MCRAAASVLSRIRLLSRLPADVIRFIQRPSIRAPLGRGDRTDGSCGSAGWRSDCAKHLSRNLLPIRPCAVGASRTTTFSQTPSTIHRLRFSMPGEPVRAKEWRLGTCRDWIRRRHQTRDEAVLPPQQRQHRVAHRPQVPPQIKQPVPARRYFPQDLLGREASKKLVCPLDLRLPYFQPETYVRALVFHGSISLRLLPLICDLEKSFRTWEALRRATEYRCPIDPNPNSSRPGSGVRRSADDRSGARTRR